MIGTILAVIAWALIAWAIAWGAREQRKDTQQRRNGHD